ncbi:hypothetical protein [Aureispira sp. CCB-QB1]|uniref:hypothetical protein n=1 Tax=Aureispira sp. CCB-QB1 TaxID=1313421 RepID=UPI000696E4EC|nr:hypothetical protein [Aureispira sp. CCB-QB1]
MNEKEKRKKDVRDMTDIIVFLIERYKDSVNQWNRSAALCLALEKHYVKQMSELTDKSIEDLRLEIHNLTEEVENDLNKHSQEEFSKLLETNDLLKKLLKNN